jgi:hypothetical protein
LRCFPFASARERIRHDSQFRPPRVEFCQYTQTDGDPRNPALPPFAEQSCCARQCREIGGLIMSGEQQHIPSQKARGGIISGRVRNVLFISFGLSILALAIVTGYFIA